MLSVFEAGELYRPKLKNGYATDIYFSLRINKLKIRLSDYYKIFDDSTHWEGKQFRFKKTDILMCLDESIYISENAYKYKSPFFVKVLHIQENKVIYVRCSSLQNSESFLVPDEQYKSSSR